MTSTPERTRDEVQYARFDPDAPEKIVYRKHELVDGRYIPQPQAPIKVTRELQQVPVSNLGPSCFFASLNNLVAFNPVIQDYLKKESLQSVARGRINLDVCRVSNWETTLREITLPGLLWKVKEIDQWSWDGIKKARFKSDYTIPELDADGRFMNSALLLAFNFNNYDLNHTMLFRPSGLYDPNNLLGPDLTDQLISLYGPEKMYYKWLLVQPFIYKRVERRPRIRLREDQERRKLRALRMDASVYPPVYKN